MWHALVHRVRTYRHRAWVRDMIEVTLHGMAHLYGLGEHVSTWRYLTQTLSGHSLVCKCQAGRTCLTREAVD